MKFLVLALCIAAAYAAPFNYIECVEEGYKGPLASEIELIDGETPEVHHARLEHFRIHKEIVKSLPKEEVVYKPVVKTVKYVAPTVTVTKPKYPLASEIKLKDGLTPEVHAAREEHLRIKSAIESSLPPVEEDCYEEKKHYKTVELIDGLTPEVHAAREEHFKIKSHIESQLPKEEYHAPAPVYKTVYKHVEPAKPKYPLASEIELIDGLTPEVHAAREEHLHIKSHIESQLPKEEYVAPVVKTVYKHVEKPVKLIDGLTPEVHAAREEHLRLKEELERSLPKEEVAAPVYKTVYKKVEKPVKLIDGLTPEVHAAREEHLRLKEELERSLPKEEVKPIIKTVYKTVTPTVVVHKPKVPLASEIELVDGLTPEVHAAREEHFRIHKEIVKSLPKEEVVYKPVVKTVNYKYVAPTVTVTKPKYPLASEIKLKDGLTPEVHAAREEHLRIKSAIESSLPPVEEDCYEEKKHYETVELIDGLTPEVHAAREEHLRLKTEIERTLPKEEIKPIVKTVYIEKPVYHVEKVYKKYPTAEHVELIDGLTPEVHAARQEHLRIKTEIEKNLPETTYVECEY